MVELFTIVFGYRNRDLERVQRCLDSLKKQETQNFCVIFVDYGSRTQHVYDIVSQYSFCQYIYSDTRGYPWNRAKALNIGIRKSQTHFTITSDVDMIFLRDFFTRLESYVHEKVVINARWYWLPKNFTEWNHLENFVGLPISPEAGKGGFQLVATSHLHAIQGFDEYYQYYGVEDRDMHHRLQLLGLEQTWIEPTMYHQWHETSSYNTAGFMPEGLWERMNVHFLNNQNSPIRNTSEWGSITDSQQRPVFEFIDPSKNVIIESPKLHSWNKQPWTHNKNSEFLHFITQLPPENALLIPDYYAPHPSKITHTVIRALNKMLKEFGKNSPIDYHVNRLRLMLALIIEDTHFFKDYYLSPDNTFAIFVKH